MGPTNNTIVITGGSSGLGLEMAGQFLAKGNTVIICGRDGEKLQKSRERFPDLNCFKCDLAEEQDCETFFQWVQTNFPQCNVLINNAAIVHTSNFMEDRNILAKVEKELRINFMAPVILTKLFVPLLLQNPNPCLINITTGLVYVPKSAYPVYCATKAALHSFTQTLRLQLDKEPIAIVEVLFPAVDTPWHRGNPPKIAISAQNAVKAMIRQLYRGKSEIKVGKVQLLHLLTKIHPNWALRKLNRL